MNNKPLLSICISTYNRESNLKISIDSIVKQKEFQNGTVELVISDNGSTDNTQHIIQEYQTKYDNIIFSRNDNNIGVSNFSKVLGLGHGKLLKLSNDTQVYEEDALRKLCEIVEKFKGEKPLLFFSNGYLTKSKSQSFFEKTREVPLFCNNNCFYKSIDAEQFFYKASYWITYSVYFSMWKNDFSDIGCDLSGIETEIWQTKKICQLLKKRNKAVIIPDKLFHVQMPKKKNVSYGIFHVFYDNLLTMMKEYYNSGLISSSCIDWIEKDLLFGYFPFWLYSWEEHNSTFQFSNTESLKELIYNKYSKKEYFRDFVRYYKFYSFKMKYLAR